MSIRPVKRITAARPTIEGAGVHLRRAFGFGQTSDYDPFLLLDDFRNDVPQDYLAGFPWHPHRGIETITYVLTGTVDHADSLGNHGTIGSGDIQWMTAGSGIIHQEMPKGDATGSMHGFQLWANLPAPHKMTKPRYQEVKSVDIPELTDDDGTRVRLVCGHFWGKTGPVEGIAADPTYIDVSVPPGSDGPCPWNWDGTRLLMCSEDRERSAMRRNRSPFRRRVLDGGPTPHLRPKPITVRCCFSTAATRLWCRVERTASASSSSPASRFGSPLPGTDRL